MRTLIPFEFAELGALEFAWLILAFGGLSLVAPIRRRLLGAFVVGALLAGFGLVRAGALGAESGAWNRWLGPLLVVPPLGAGVMLLGSVGALRRRAALWAWLAALVGVSAAGAFQLGPPGLSFLGLVGIGLVAAVGGENGLRSRLDRRVWHGLALCFLLVCLVLEPFGVTLLGGLALSFLAWLVHAVIEQGREMRRYVLRRLSGAPVVLLILCALSFFMMRRAPGGPFDKEKRLDADVKMAVEAKYGLDKPLPVQFVKYIAELVWDGNLGPSFKQKGRTVNDVIGNHIGPSATLGLAAICLALLIGTTAGLISGIRHNSIFDYASMTGATIGLALPTFVVGPMLVLLFTMKLDWFRVTGWESFPRDLVLPAITLSLPFAARIARLTRAGMLEIVNQDYIRTARAKGLSEPVIVVRHTLKGTLLPVVSFLGPGIAQLLTGSLVVEKIFGVPGMGLEFIQSALNRDYAVAMGLVLVYGSLLIVFNLVVDIAYAFLDPRIRHA